MVHFSTDQMEIKIKIKMAGVSKTTKFSLRWGLSMYLVFIDPFGNAVPFGEKTTQIRNSL